MRLTPTLLTLAALAALASNAHAATYWLGGGGPRAWWFVDSDTIERDRDHPRGWILNVYRGKVTYKAVADDLGYKYINAESALAA